MRTAAAITLSSDASFSAWIHRSMRRIFLPLRHVGVGDRAEALVRVGGDRLLADRAEARATPRRGTRDTDRASSRNGGRGSARDARLARDLRGRRTAVARAREDAAGGVEHRLPPRLRGQPLLGPASCRLDRRARPAPRAGARPCGSPSPRRPRRRGTSSAPTRSASWKPVRKLAWRAATIAPITAIPSDPPTWRAEFRTAEPTPALSTGTALIAAAVTGVIVSAHARRRRSGDRAGAPRSSRALRAVE